MWFFFLLWHWALDTLATTTAFHFSTVSAIRSSLSYCDVTTRYTQTDIVISYWRRKKDVSFQITFSSVPIKCKKSMKWNDLIKLHHTYSTNVHNRLKNLKDTKYECYVHLIPSRRCSFAEQKNKIYKQSTTKPEGNISLHIYHSFTIENPSSMCMKNEEKDDCYALITKNYKLLWVINGGMQNCRAVSLHFVLFTIVRMHIDEEQTSACVHSLDRIIIIIRLQCCHLMKMYGKCATFERAHFSCFIACLL